MKLNTSLTTTVIMLLFALAAKAQMRVHLINVGQGSATLIEFPCAAILVDTGGESDSLFNSKEALKSYLDDFFSRRDDLRNTLHCVYLTHPHKDHTLGMPVLLDTFYTIRNAVTDGLVQGSGKVGQIKLHKRVQDLEENGDPADDIGFVPVTTDMIGDSGLTNGVIDPVNCTGTNPVVRVLWGTSAINPGWSNTEFNNANNHSLVIKVEYGVSSLLITGDLEDVAQRNLVAKYDGTCLLNADVYVVGHHGSKNGTSSAFLKKVRPQMALIGVGSPDRQLSWTAWAYGHPNKLIMDSLQKRLTALRTPVQVMVGTKAKTFVPYTISKAIYGTGWDDNVVLEADSAGRWRRVEATLVPTQVNINTATELELETLPGIGATKAQAIVAFRNRHGKFTSIEDLDRVPGIGPSTINLVRPYIRIGN